MPCRGVRVGGETNWKARGLAVRHSVIDVAPFRSIPVSSHQRGARRGHGRFCVRSMDSRNETALATTKYALHPHLFAPIGALVAIRREGGAARERRRLGDMHRKAHAQAVPLSTIDVVPLARHLFRLQTEGLPRLQQVLPSSTNRAHAPQLFAPWWLRRSSSRS